MPPVVLARWHDMDHDIAVGVQAKRLGGGHSVGLAALEIQLGHVAGSAEVVQASVHGYGTHALRDLMVVLGRQMDVLREVGAILRASWRELSMLAQATGFLDFQSTTSSWTSTASLS
jgi:hypothetical protein